MKELTKEERFALAAKLEAIHGVDLSPDEHDALNQAIAIVSPEYAAAVEDDLDEAEAWFDSLTPETAAELDKAVENTISPPSGPVIPFPKGGKK